MQSPETGAGGDRGGETRACGPVALVLDTGVVQATDGGAGRCQKSPEARALAWTPVGDGCVGQRSGEGVQGDLPEPVLVSPSRHDVPDAVGQEPVPEEDPDRPRVVSSEPAVRKEPVDSSS